MTNTDKESKNYNIEDQDMAKILLTELLHTIITESSCTVELNKILKAMNRDVNVDICDNFLKCASIVVDYKTRLLNILSSNKWYDQFGEKINVEINDYIKETVSAAKVEPLEIHVADNLLPGVDLTEEFTDVLTELLDSNDEEYSKIQKNEINKRIANINLLYDTLPFR